MPKFAWDWLKDTSVSAIRESRNPNRRVQDGFKARLLCHDCEQRLSRLEKPFAEHLFAPIHRGVSPHGLQYGPWALAFAVSVAWRILVWDSEQPESSDHLSPKQRNAVTRAESVWRRFLLGEAPHPGKFEQHILILDLVESHSTNGLSPFFNRYIARTLDMDLLASKRSAVTFAKLGKILLFGQVDGPSSEWKGTKLHLRGGAFLEKYLRIPTGIFEYLNEKADRAKAALDGLSPRQAEKAQEAIWKSPDRVLQSYAFEALMRDAEFSGAAAFRPRKTDGT